MQRASCGPKPLPELQLRLRLRIVPHHYAPLQPLVRRCAGASARLRADWCTRRASDTLHILAGALARRQAALVLTVHDPCPSGNDAHAAALFARYNGASETMANALITHGAGWPTNWPRSPRSRASGSPIPHGVVISARSVPQAPAARSAPADLLRRMSATRASTRLSTPSHLGCARARRSNCWSPVPARDRPARRTDGGDANLRLHGNACPGGAGELVASSRRRCCPSRRDERGGGISAGRGVPVIGPGRRAAGGDPGRRQRVAPPPGDPSALAQAVCDSSKTQRFRIASAQVPARRRRASWMGTIADAT